MVKTVVKRKEKVSFEVRYFITSLTSVDNFEYSVRKHWAIENQLHWCLDVIWREDGSRAKKDNAPLNLNILDKTALALVNKADLGKMSKNHKRYKATLNTDVLLSMILCRD